MPVVNVKGIGMMRISQQATRDNPPAALGGVYSRADQQRAWDAKVQGGLQWAGDQLADVALDEYGELNDPAKLKAALDNKFQEVRGFVDMATQGLTPLQKAAFLTMPYNGLGDFAQFGADMEMYITDPESRTWFNAAMTGTGVAGGAMTISPAMAGILPIVRKNIDTSRMARADEMGLTTDLYHGTHADIDEFDPNMVDIGTHLGTSEQANERLKDVYKSRNGLSTFVAGDTVEDGANIMRVRANLGKSLDMNDVGMWNDSEKVISELEDMPEFRGKFDDAWEELGVKDSYGDSQDWIDGPENREMLDEINAEIRRQGYDSIRYANQVENKYGNLAGTRPEVAARKKTLNDELKEIDLSGRHTPREAPTIEDLSINPNAVEEWVKEFDIQASYSPQQEQRMAQINQELKSLDEIGQDDIYSHIILDPSKMRSVNAQFNPSKAGSGNLLAGAAGAAIATKVITDTEDPNSNINSNQGDI
jgi:hypothetical protein